MSAREAAIVKRLLQQLVEMYAQTAHGTGVDMEGSVRLVGVLRRSEIARADPILMQCCEALGEWQTG